MTELDLRCWGQTPHEARLTILHSGALEISGRIRGPYCQHSRTLPCSLAIRRGEVHLVDPCYWTPALPFRYELQLDIQLTDGSRITRELLWGLRWCVAQGRDIRLNGKRAVIRGVAVASEQLELDAMRASATAWVTRLPDPQLLEAASREGVLVVVDDESDSSSVLRELNLHAAVHFLRDRGRRARSATATRPLGVPWVEAAELTRLREARGPLFVLREATGNSWADLRRGCDALQRELSPFGQFAGYLVHAGLLS